MTLESLQIIARDLQKVLAENRRPEAEGDNPLTVQALCVAEEAGEMVGAYRRWAGLARRLGIFEHLVDEVADVFITTAIFADMAGIDIDQAISDKLVVIYDRGWKEEDSQ